MSMKLDTIKQWVIQAALDEWRSINSDDTKWATFECVYFNTEIRVCIACGSKFFGRKEQTLQHIIWTIYPDGNWHRTLLTHA